jgi:hypothetical protein
MKRLYSTKVALLAICMWATVNAYSQVPTTLTPGLCAGVVANFNTNDNGFNSPSIYGSIFDSSFYYHAGRGYWTDYLPPFRTGAPGAPRVLNIISPPFSNPNPTGTFNVGFYYIVNNPAVDRFQVRIISVTTTPTGTLTNVEATSGVQFFSSWSTPSPYVDGVTTPVADPTPFLTGSQGFVCVRLLDPDIVNGPNTTFRVEVSYLLSTPFFAVFDNLSIGPLNSPLPVNFIGGFVNRGANNTASVRWDVGEEIDVKEYQVERSTNGSVFTIQGVVAAGNKSGVYSFTDADVPSATVYYRIKSIDNDGKFKYSSIFRLKGNAVNSYNDNVTIYPVPATNNITIEHKRLNSKSRMTITTTDGKVIKTIIPGESSSHTTVNIDGLVPGMYFVRLDDGTGNGYGPAVKFIKN